MRVCTAVMLHWPVGAPVSSTPHASRSCRRHRAAQRRRQGAPGMPAPGPLCAPANGSDEEGYRGAVCKAAAQSGMMRKKVKKCSQKRSAIAVVPRREDSLRGGGVTATQSGIHRARPAPHQCPPRADRASARLPQRCWSRRAGWPASVKRYHPARARPVRQLRL